MTLHIKNDSNTFLAISKFIIVKYMSNVTDMKGPAFCINDHKRSNSFQMIYLEKVHFLWSS